VPVSRDLERLRQLEAEFDFLRDKILKAARALVLVEDNRAQLLARLGRAGRLATHGDLARAQTQAGENADAATSITVQADKMDRFPTAVHPMRLVDAADEASG
jgi:hypothetical protein